MKLRPDLQISVATAQSIADTAGCEGAVATISMLHGGEIAAVHEMGFADPARRALVLKVYPDDLHWKMQKEVTVIGLVQDRHAHLRRDEHRHGAQERGVAARDHRQLRPRQHHDQPVLKDCAGSGPHSGVKSRTII